MRANGPISTLAGLEPGSHVCWSFQSHDELLSGVAAYFAEGLAAHDKLLFFRDGPELDEVVAALDRAGLPTAELSARGQLLIMDAPIAYLDGAGRFDADVAVGAFHDQSRLAVAEGYRALRAVGEMAWVYPDVVDQEALLAYEAKADRVAAASPLVGACAYDARRCDPQHIHGLETVHPLRLRTGSRAGLAPFCLFTSGDGELGVQGEVDFVAADAFRDALRLATVGLGDVRLDLGQLQFIGLAGIEVVVGFAKALADEGRTLTLAAAPPSLRACWSLLDLHRIDNVVLA